MRRLKIFKVNSRKYKKINLIDSLLTILILIFIIIVFFVSFNWIFFLAQWDVVTNNISTFSYGFFPKEEAWRVNFWLGILALVSILTLVGRESNYIRQITRPLWIVIIPLGLILLAGGFGLQTVEARNWGGLSLTLILTLVSTLISIPTGILLALGRQSKLKSIKILSGLYIDIMRSFPLITVLFFGQLLIPLFLPIEVEINRVIRSIIAFSLFTSAYIAEDIKGGLQAIPATQKEASAVLGFNPQQTMQIIILPQAFRIALPSLTNQAIGLLQNTSLMAILGLVELMGIGKSLLANPEFIGRYLEVYIWLAFVYWLICTILALLSKQLETSLDLTTKNK